MRKPKHYIKELKRFVKNSKKAFDIINKDQISDISKDVRRLDTSIKGLDKTTKQTTKEIAEDIQELQNLTHEIPVESITQLIGNINSFKTRFFHDNKDLLNRIPNSDKLITSCITNGIEFLYYSSEEDKMYFETKEGTVLATDLYYGIVLQMFAEKTYTIPPHFRNTEYVAFDFGMNRGYSTLWFAQDSNCKKVYGFEIDRDTYKYALDNFNLNPHLRDKIEGFDYGLSNTNEDIDLTYIPGQDSVSTISKDFEDNYYSTQRKMIVQKKKANVRKSSEVITELIKRENIKDALLLKIDVEGAEYDIFDDLIDSNILSKFSLIFGESHNGMEKIHSQLKDFRLLNEVRVTDQLSNFCFINKDFTSV